LGREIRSGLDARIVFSEVLFRASIENTITSIAIPSCLGAAAAQKSLDQYNTAEFRCAGRRWLPSVRHAFIEID